MLLFTFQEVLVVVTGGEVLWCGKEVGTVVWALLSCFRRFGLLLLVQAVWVVVVFCKACGLLLLFKDVWVAVVYRGLGCCCAESLKDA